MSLPYLGFNWYHLLPAWLFYYVLGYYSGRDRNGFQAVLRRHWAAAVALLVGSATLLISLTVNGFLPDVTSQRFDVMLYAAGFILVAFLVTGQIKQIPALLNAVNRASYGIYLLHWFFLELFVRVARGPLFALPREIAILILWVAAALASGLVTFGLNRFRWGAFVVGKLGVDGRARPAPAAAEEPAPVTVEAG